MQEKKQQCKNCGSYRAYYEKLFYGFDKMDFGECRRFNKTVEEDEGCECAFWKDNHKIRQKRKEIAFRKIAALANELLPLKQILEEEIEENKIDPLR